MPTAEELKQRIEAALPGARAEVEDLTGGGDHFRAEVVSDRFDGLSRIEQHQLVYGVFGDEVGGAIHALSIKTSTPEATRMTNDEIRDFIQQAIDENQVMLFMKGTPEQPACGFSARTSGALNALGVQLRGARHPARPAHPPGAVGPVGLADDPAAVRRGRAGRRLRHRHGDVRDGRAGRALGVEQPEDDETPRPPSRGAGASGADRLENRLD